MFKRDWNSCLKYDYLYRLNSQQNGGNLYEHFDEHKNLHFHNEDIYISSNNYEESEYDLNLDLLTILY